MGSFVKSLSTAVLVAACGTSAYGYAYTGVGNAGGWDNINGSPTVTTVLDQSDYTADTDFNSVSTALLNAYATWDAVGSAQNLSFNYRADSGGNYDLYDTYPSYDSAANYTYANITMGGWRDAAWFNNFGSGVLAVAITGTYGGTWVSDIFFNDGYNWTTSGSGGYDIETVALHELGHSLGLGHENSNSSVMASYYGGVKRTLEQDDIDGITSLYGDGTTGGGGKGKPDKGDKPGGGSGGGGGGGNGKGPNKLTGLDGFELTSMHITYASSEVAAVPEPASLAMLALGGLLVMRRRR